jgi:hypothetical protein
LCITHISAMRAETWSIFDLIALQNRPARSICVPSVPKASAGRSITVGNGERTARCSTSQKQTNPMSRGTEKRPFTQNLTAPIAVTFTASIAVGRSARSSPNRSDDQGPE